MMNIPQKMKAAILMELGSPLKLVEGVSHA